MKRVVVTGLGALTPLGNTVESYWQSLIQGKSGAAPITRFDATPFKTQFACELKQFDPLNYMDKSEARKSDPFVQYALAAAALCMEDANFGSGFDKDRTGVVWASGIGGIQTFEEAILEFVKGGEVPRFNPFFITKLIPNMAAAQISMRYGLRGMSTTSVSACASSNSAIFQAFLLVRAGYAHAVLTGGSEAAITRASIGGFNAARALSTRNDSPETASRPFDASRDGFVMGEGAGAMMFEELGHARSRGAKIYCEIVGVGGASDAFHITAPHPEGEGLVIAMQQALDDAGLSPAQVDYINTHGTGTPLGDVSECKAIENLFADHLHRLHISATKSMTGHLLGGAGAIEAIACVKAIEQGVVPPTINLTTPDPEIDPRLNLTPGNAVKKDIRLALNNTLGFGGHIVVSAFKRFDDQA